MKNDSTQNLATFLGLLRIARGLTQTEVASKLGVESGTVSDYERGKVDFPISRLIQISKIYDFPIDGFLKISQHKPKGIQS
jgi:transcriptional regulator with XRE-family HTH domain